MITSLIRPAPILSTADSALSQDTPEDILSHGLPLLFPDEARNQHGDPGSKIVYASKAFGDMTLELADPVGEQERRLFAHYIWNAGVILAELIGQEWLKQKELGSRRKEGDKGERKWTVDGHTVLELGAGTGLVSITALIAGADSVVVTDYPAPTLVSVLQRNVAMNVLPSRLPRIQVLGHTWGSLPSPSPSNNHTLHSKPPEEPEGHSSPDPLSTRYPSHTFQTILAADTLWMSGQHENLLKSMAYFLSLEETATVWVVAGFHTGRGNVVRFFERVGEVGLEVREIWERDVEGNERPWRGRGEGEDGVGGDGAGKGEKRWCVIGILGWQREMLRGGQTDYESNQSA